MPGEIWYQSFTKRNSAVLTSRLGKNMKRSRTAVSRETINAYFDKLNISLTDIPPKNIIKYNETNFSDNHRRKKLLVTQTSKHVDTILWIFPSHQYRYVCS